MKDLTKFLFCIFAFTVVISCEPEEIDQLDVGHKKKIIQVVPSSDTGNQGEVLDDEKT